MLYKYGLAQLAAIQTPFCTTSSLLTGPSCNLLHHSGLPGQPPREPAIDTTYIPDSHARLTCLKICPQRLAVLHVIQREMSCLKSRDTSGPAANCHQNLPGPCGNRSASVIWSNDATSCLPLLQDFRYRCIHRRIARLSSFSSSLTASSAQAPSGATVFNYGHLGNMVVEHSGKLHCNHAAAHIGQAVQSPAFRFASNDRADSHTPGRSAPGMLFMIGTAPVAG